MKLRNQLLALACLVAFVALGVLYFRTWVVQKPFALILFMSDGLTTEQLTAARLFEGGADHRLNLEELPALALVSNQARDFAVPDSAAASSAIATGVKVNNRSIALDVGGAKLESILKAARNAGRAVGVISNGKLTDASLAPFYAHASGPNETESIASQLCDASLDLVLGGGTRDFVPESKGGARKDGRDLLLELKGKGVELIRSKAELENAVAFRTASLVGLFSDGDLAFSDQLDSGSQQPTLSDMVRRAIQMLQFNQRGYLLIVDAALQTRASERNESQRAIAQTLELDHALATALEYAGESALILAVGKHSTGGMTLNGYPLRTDHGVALLGTNPFGYPSITWSTGPKGTPQQSAESPTPAPDGRTEPAAFYTPAAINTANDTIAVGTGPGSEALKGFLDNTAIYKILKANL